MNATQPTEPTQTAPPNSCPGAAGLRWTKLQLVMGLLLISSALSTLSCRELIPGWRMIKSKEAEQVAGQPEAQSRLSLSLVGTRNNEARTMRESIVPTVNRPPYPPTVKLSWTPPKGVTDIYTYPTPDPGGPPFVWSQLAVDPATGRAEEVIVHCTAPPDLPTGGVHTFTVEAGGQRESRSAYGLGAETAALAQGAGPPVAALNSTSYLWEITEWYGWKGMAMTSSLCQSLIETVQDDRSFIAVRFPVFPPTTTASAPYALPIVYRGSYSPTLSLVRYSPNETLLSLPLDYRPERFTFLEEELPSAPGEHWLALGVPADITDACPPALDIPAGDWEFEVDGALDFGGELDTCAGCELQMYYCYEGQQSSFLPAASGAALATGLAHSAYQGITCLGPHYLRLGASRWDLAEASAAVVTPTMPISLHHYIFNSGSGTVTAALECTSTLGIGWSLYSGDQDSPNLSTPISGPIEIGHAGLHFWLISAPVPEIGLAGPHTVYVTATDVNAPQETRHTTDLLWIGEWGAPPTVDFRVYLPRVLRNHSP